MYIVHYLVTHAHVEVHARKSHPRLVIAYAACVKSTSGDCVSAYIHVAEDQLSLPYSCTDIYLY